MKETPSDQPEQRTEWNVRDSDGTLIIVNEPPMGGTLYTIEMARKYEKPFFILDLLENYNVDDVVSWIQNHNIRKLNIAGSRASQSKNVYRLACDVIKELLIKTVKF